MVINEDSLVVRDRKLKPEDIKEIRIQGYFKPAIGIIPTGKILTPFGLHFRYYMKEEDNAIKELKEWTKEHGVKISMNKQIRRWF